MAVKLVSPVPPFVVASVPARVTAPEVAVLGVNPVVPALKDATVPAVVAKVPLVGNVTFVAPVVVSVRELAPEVASVEPLASVSVPVVLLTVRPLIDVAVAAPRTGVTSVGDVAKTKAPEPVSFVTAAARLADEGVARNVATPEPRPDTPVLIGKPVALVSVAAEGVPRFGVVNAGELAKTKEPVPVSSVTAAARFAELGVARNVATPAPRPEMPVATGSPVALVKVAAEGVPRFGVVSAGLFDRTTEPVPVDVVTPVPPLATPSVPAIVSVPEAVIGPPENVRPVVPPEASTEVTVPT